MNAIVEMKPARAAMSTGILNPTTLAEALQMAEVISKSSIVPKDYQGNPGNVLVAIQWGMEIGLPPLQAMQNIAVINGRPSLWGDALLALCKASPLCEYITETVDGDTAVCVAKRRGDPHPVVREFSVEDAKKAGLWQTDPRIKRRNRDGGTYETDNDSAWFRYPKRMLQMRARGHCLRDAFPDVLKGMAVAEEESDKVVTGTAETTGPAHKPASRTDALKAKINESLIKAGAMPAIIPDEPPAGMNPETGEIPHPDIGVAALLAAIAACNSAADVKELAKDAGHLSDSEKDQVRQAMRARIAELKTDANPR